MKKKIIVLLLVAASVLTVACSSDRSEEGPDILLKSFVLKAGGVNYHADIDQDDRIARIGTIQYSGQISGVEYRLAEGATIDPDPESLVTEWPERQEFTVSGNGRVETYTVWLSAYVAKWPDTRRIVLAEQARHYVAIVDANSQRIEWTWDLAKSGLPEEHRSWFTYPTEVKPVYNCEGLLVVTNDGVGLIRRADHRMIWYTASGGGFPHSAELLPDGNIAVVYSSSDTSESDKLKIFRVDYTNFPATEAAAEYPLKSGHNAVWDRKNEVLWATTYTTINGYAYGLKDGTPALTLRESILLPDGSVDPHDLFPVYGERKLWLTTSDRLYKFDPDRKRFETVAIAENLMGLKSVSSGPAGYPTIVLRPTESWWSNELVDTDGAPVYTGPEYLRIYKGRWLVDNTFSYPENHRPPVE